MHDFPGKERRKYVRIPFQRTIQYRVCYERFTSDILDANASNISQNGILFKTKYPPPTASVLALNIPIDKLKEYFIKEHITDCIDPDTLLVRGHSIFGEVVRIIKEDQSGFFSVAVKLILKKDPDAQEKIKRAGTNHPQYRDPSQIPDEDKYIKPQAPAHPQYIDPTKIPLDEIDPQ